MAKFCAECGGTLGPADKFCAECGMKIIHTCPTCGQNWDGVKQESEPTVPAKGAPKSVASSAVKTTTAPVPQPTKPAAKYSQITTARVQPVYGSQFNASTDCANCGSKGNKKSCSNCGAGE